MAFRFDKLTIKAQEAVQVAQKFEEDHSHQQLLPLHLLDALLKEEQGVVGPLMEKIGAQVGQLKSMVESELNRQPAHHGSGWRGARSGNQQPRHGCA